LSRGQWAARSRRHVIYSSMPKVCSPAPHGFTSNGTVLMRIVHNCQVNITVSLRRHSKHFTLIYSAEDWESMPSPNTFGGVILRLHRGHCFRPFSPPTKTQRRSSALLDWHPSHFSKTFAILTEISSGTVLQGCGSAHLTTSLFA
jgi:hypothetical protein